MWRKRLSISFITGFAVAVGGACNPGVVGRPGTMTPTDGGRLASDSGARPDGPPVIVGYGVDTDSDGLSDDEEAIAGTDPYERDTDRDGVTDLAELRGTMTNPLDPASTVARDDYFVVLPYNAPSQTRPLRFGTNVEIADVYFLMDTTGSMYPEVQNVQNGMEHIIVPGVRDLIRDVWFGAGGFGDYPAGSAEDTLRGYSWVQPHGESTAHNPGCMMGRPSCRVSADPTGGCCADTDIPFYQLSEMVPFEQDRGGWTASGPFPMVGSLGGAANGTPDILDAIRAYPRHHGGNICESGAQAIYAMATGSGLSWPTTPWGEAGSIPSHTCSVGPDDPPRRGYPCFRMDALPIVIYVSDATIHGPLPDGWAADTLHPGTACEYQEVPGAPSARSAVDALRALNARVISLATVEGPSSGGVPALEHMCSWSRETGAVRADGTPLCFAIGSSGTNITGDVIDAIRELVGGTPQDVNTRLENVAGNPHDFDATRFIRAVTPVEGYRASGESGAHPGTTYRSKDATTFYEVIPGTQVEFNVVFENTVFPPEATTVIFQAKIVVIGNHVTALSFRNVYIVVPPEGAGPILI